MVWLVEEGDTKHYFVCSPCAIDFYNADRERRSPPQEGDAPAGAKVRDKCPC